ncbi:nuclear transport factor 2 family protein [Pseudomonas gingeri]|uniref:nuclear transport factor 2 family protein n=1 Tax=Pseudomonas gingeri TaxID=117681 RepID=UPI0015A2ADFB|nr:nuclear transport factor 2 family protein [Pseudomonas gingeri]NWD73149.1 nuclear transport factor 2 family protein [Pseudomonas gingeri]
MHKRIIGHLLITSALVGSLSLSALAQTPPPTSSIQVQKLVIRNKITVETALNGWMTGDGKALQALLSDDIEWTITGNSAAAGTTRGRTELTQKVLGPFSARFSAAGDPFRPRKINGVYADGDTVIAHFEGSGMTNDGKRYSNDYVWLLTMSDGKAVKGTAFFDSIAFNELWRVKPAQ